MEHVQMLVPIEPKEFWSRLRSIVEEVIMESKKEEAVDKHAERPLNGPPCSTMKCWQQHSLTGYYISVKS